MSKLPTTPLWIKVLLLFKRQRFEIDAPTGRDYSVKIFYKRLFGITYIVGEEFTKNE